MTLQAAEFHMHAMQTQADANAFRTLNEEWIERHFRLEDKDRRTLGDPQREIIAKGGHVYLGELAGRHVACVALIPFEGGEYELSKMAVAPDQRGRGLGRRMLLYALDQARRWVPDGFSSAATAFWAMPYACTNRSALSMSRRRICRTWAMLAQTFTWPMLWAAPPRPARKLRKWPGLWMWRCPCRWIVSLRTP